VAPLRAGGGSRIKLLEAFAYGVPVVASPTAAAGLDVAHDRELLLAESDREIAAAASRLAGDPTLAHRLATAASAFVAAHHDMDRTSERLRELVTAKLPPS
jgi:glycosyltransferase involved in cell wall biosynthesis